jgi:hypothetical protein
MRPQLMHRTDRTLLSMPQIVNVAECINRCQTQPGFQQALLNTLQFDEDGDPRDRRCGCCYPEALRLAWQATD